MANHRKICLNDSGKHLTPSGYSDFLFKNRREMLICYSDTSEKIIGKTNIRTIFSGYLLLNTQIMIMGVYVPNAAIS